MFRRVHTFTIFAPPSVLPQMLAAAKAGKAQLVMEATSPYRACAEITIKPGLFERPAKFRARVEAVRKVLS